MFRFLPFFRRRVGIDLGTSNSLIYLDKRGIVINEPSVVAVNTKSNQILAVGEEAKKMVGRTPLHVNVVRPLVNGVISDFEMTQEILRHFLRRAGDNQPFIGYHTAVVGVPSDLTEVERKSVEDAVRGAGIIEPYIVEEPLAAALGARLPIGEASANMIVDIGGGTSEIAIISMAGTVTSKSLKVAGDKLNDDIMRFIRDEFRLAVGEPTAEELKIAIGSALPLNQKLEMTVRGRDLATGLPKELVVKDVHVRTAIAKSLKAIVDAIKEVIEISPPELAGDILKKGIYLSGGGSLLKGLDELIARDLTVHVTVADDPLTCVVRGAGIIVENLPTYLPMLNSPLHPREIRL